MYKTKKMMPYRARLLTMLVILLGALGLSGCASGGATTAASPVSDSYFIFDTIVTVRVYDQRATKEHFRDIEKLLIRIDERMNRNLETSEIAKVNRAAGQEAVKVSEETFHVVKLAVQYAEQSGGRFDPTIGPLVDLWGIGGDQPRRPEAAEMKAALQLVNYKDVILDEAAMSLYLNEAGMSLDLGAIAKGYAADVIANYLRSQDFQSAIIDLGGNLLAMGSKARNSPWTIGVQDPEGERGNPIGNMQITNQSIVSSGVYERFFVQDDIHYHHILDTVTGFPINNDLLSVTIIADNSAEADALSTSAFSLGLQDGLAFIESLERTEAVFINKAKEVYTTSGLRDKFKLTNPGYTLK